MTKKKTISIKELQAKDGLEITSDDTKVLVFLADSEEEVNTAPFASFSNMTAFRLCAPLLKKVIGRLEKHAVFSGTAAAMDGGVMYDQPTVGDVMWLSGAPEELVHAMPMANKPIGNDIGDTSEVLEKLARLQIAEKGSSKDKDFIEEIPDGTGDNAVKISIAVTEGVEDEHVIRALEEVLKKIKREGYIDAADNVSIEVDNDTVIH